MLIGFSDVTAIHRFINHDIGWFSVHDVLAAYNQERYQQGKTGRLNMYNSITEIAQTLRGGSRYFGIAPMNQRAKSGAAEGEKQLYRQVIQDFASRAGYPVYYYPEFGHGTTNKPFILARRAEILCRADYPLCSLTQAPVISGFSDTPSTSPGVR